MPERHPTQAVCRRFAPRILHALCAGVMLGAVGLGPWAQPVLAQTNAQEARFATLVADELRIDGADRLVAQGNVEALFGTTRLQARRVVYNRRDGSLQIDGPLVLNDGREVIILADQAEMSDALRRGLIRSARVVFDEQLQIAAHSVERLDGRFTEMNNVIASSCEICAQRRTPLWEIRARRVVHDEMEQQVYFENAQFRMFGLPLAYIPRLRVPDPRLQRASGFLSPRFSIDTGHGVGLRTPYFLVLSQDRDLTLTPFLGSKGTQALEFRYRQAFASGRLEFGGLVARDSIRPGTTRGFGYAEGEFALGRGYTFSFNLIQPTDKRVLDDYDRGAARLTSDITLQQVRRDARMRVQLLQFRSMRLNDANATLPNQVGQAVLERRMDVPGLGGVAGFRLEAHVHQRRQALGAAALPAATPSMTTGARPRRIGRLSLDLDWRRDTVLPWGVLGAVGGQVGLDQFSLSDTGGAFPNSATRITPNLMAELRWPLVRSGANAVTHVIEPVAQVIWGRDRLDSLPHEGNRMPELDEGNLFSYDRFASRDSREGGLRANLGISWTRRDADGWSSTLTLGRIWRQRDPGQFASATPLSGAQSDWFIAGSIDTLIGLQLSNRSVFTSDFRLQRTALELDWTSENYTISTSYMRIIDNPFEGRLRSASEWSFDGTRDIDDFWTARVGWRYDIARNRAARAMVGLGYENECLRMAIGIERQFASATSVDDRTSLGLSVDILGLGGNPSRARSRCNDI
ncbi:LPS-assembly protein [Roseinatronobacter thiooxidans]|uniref:LPS-assembly protein LptD n=2 Tax=Roseinatronobacter thiooxidans TaxID=121821 RepID=A0A2W7QH98_9RHOB|nr:LPS-assembly protein [Roseinatronobacter thiooxidans]